MARKQQSRKRRVKKKYTKWCCTTFVLHSTTQS